MKLLSGLLQTQCFLHQVGQGKNKGMTDNWQPGMSGHQCLVTAGKNAASHQLANHICIKILMMRVKEMLVSLPRGIAIEIIADTRYNFCDFQSLMEALLWLQ